MDQTTPRRTPAHKVRHTISEVLEQVDAIEYALGLYQHKGSNAELARARENFRVLLGHVDHLGEIIANLDQPETDDHCLVEAAE
jgi:hypothetical protein